MAVNAQVDRQIRDVIASWLDAVDRKDTAAIAQFYTAHGRLLVPNAPAAEGREAVAALWSKLVFLPGLALTFGPTMIEAAQSRDLAYEVGTYALGFDGKGGRTEDRGKYVAVWKQEGGAWKVAVGILNSDLPVRRWPTADSTRIVVAATPTETVRR